VIEMSTVDLAVIGNGMFGALVDGRGRFVWCCLASFNGDPVFNCLVNNNSDQTGFYDVLLEDFERAEQTYLSRSCVLVTTLHTSQGDKVEIRDFAPRFYHFDRLFRPFQLIRTVRRLKGDPRVVIRIRPTFQYNSTDGYQTRGSQHVRFCGPTHTWRATTNTSVRHILEEIPFLVPVEPVYIIFGSDESFQNSLHDVASDFEVRTVRYWKDWCNSLCLPVEFQEVLVRAAMTLALLQSGDSGGFLASLTMGLPLGPLGGATRDTRVCRMLDESLALTVLRDLGLLDACRRFLGFAKEVCFQATDPQHTYNPWGSVQFQQQEWTPYLAGYRGMGEVNSGGPLLEPASQVTESAGVIYGLLVIALAHAFFDIRLSEELCTPKLFEKLELYAIHACRSFDQISHLYRSYVSSQKASLSSEMAVLATGDRRENDGNGIPRPGQRVCLPSGAGFFDDDASFLLREDLGAGGRVEGAPGGPEPAPPIVHSLTTVICWAAADRLQRIAKHFSGDADKAQYWQRRALEIHDEVSRQAWSERRGAFTTYWGGNSVGPSVLRLSEIGFVSSEDARFQGTVRAFEEDAAHCAVCVRGPDGSPSSPHSERGRTAAGDGSALLSASSSCFMTSTLLWYCEALRSTGAPEKARRLLLSLVRCSGHQGLLAESVDLKTTELWGNVPSAAALLALLRVAPRLSRSWREV